MSGSPAANRAFQHEQYRGFAEFAHESAPVLNAREVLDAQGFMKRTANRLAQERMNGEAQAAQDPLVDLLGSARLLLALEEEGWSTDDARSNLRNDIRTGLLEATQEKGHISTYEVALNANGEATVGGVPFFEIFLHGIHPGRSQWANEHATINIHEEFLNAAHFAREQLRRDYGMMIVSPLPEDVGVDAKALRREGYRPDSRKMMVRMHHFAPEGLGWKRVTEQLCISGSDITVINQVLREFDVVADDEPDLTTTEVLDRPFLLRRQKFSEGAAVFARLFDELKAEQDGQSYFCGGEAQTDAPDELYVNLAHASKEREAALGAFIDELEQYAYLLVCNEALSFDEQTRAYGKKTREMVRRICAIHPEYAEHAFGKEAAEKYQRAYQKLEDGDWAGADAELADAFELSTSIVMCGVELEDEASTSTSSEGSGLTVASAAERQEALHCMKIKMRGFTIRPEVKCPECTPVTGRKVRALETAHDIACLNDDCNYKLGKDGTVLRASKIHTQTQTAAVPPVPENVVPLRPVALQEGRRYQVGGVAYEFRLELGVGDARPQFVTPEGSVLSGREAWQLQRTIQLSLN